VVRAVASESSLDHRSCSTGLAVLGLLRIFLKSQCRDPCSILFQSLLFAVVSRGEQNNVTGVKMINLVQS